ncbi:MAG TPA: methyltransferase domain-containing protein, partial [Dehalococcoidia bacterium]|nr:methyltransferase domain-containing protein [Dehalococcoidia bacterium]
EDALTQDHVPFKSLEHAGWSEAGVSRTYETYFTSLTSQSIEPLLDAVKAGPGVRLLDVATGPGHLASIAKQRGADVVGSDVSPSMVEIARGLYRDVEFRAGDAEELPFEDASFDAVVMNYGLLHLSRPELAIAEAFRVLRPGGRFAFTVWAPPDRARGFGLILEAVAAVGNPGVPLPPGPPFFRFADAKESKRVLEATGFIDTNVVDVPQRWSLPDADALLEVFEEGTVRTRALLKGQTPDQIAAIREAVVRSAQQFATATGLDIPMPSVLSSGRKP